MCYSIITIRRPAIYRIINKQRGPVLSPNTSLSFFFAAFLFVFLFPLPFSLGTIEDFYNSPSP